MNKMIFTKYLSLKPFIEITIQHKEWVKYSYFKTYWWVMSFLKFSNTVVLWLAVPSQSNKVVGLILAEKLRATSWFLSHMK